MYPRGSDTEGGSMEPRFGFKVFFVCVWFVFFFSPKDTEQYWVCSYPGTTDLWWILFKGTLRKYYRRDYDYICLHFVGCDYSLWLVEKLTALNHSVSPTSHFSHLACFFFFLLHFGLFVVGCRNGNLSQWLWRGLGGWSSRHSIILKKLTKMVHHQLILVRMLGKHDPEGERI